MPPSEEPLLPVTLANCDREPIHIPGSIQPQGALLAFDAAGELVAFSANTSALLQISPALGMQAGELGLPEPVLRVILDYVREAESGLVPPTPLDTQLNGRDLDFVVHAYAGRVIAEFELRAGLASEAAAFALKAHVAIDRIKRQSQLPALLNLVVEHIRAITGFDRVMAYRFRHDDSGDIVAESRTEGMESFLGMRYPASDIPAQARRLYTINTLRLIGDVDYQPVPLLGREGAAPLDLSHGILRSVSPIHVEYLQNMGVRASMSVSIVVNGRLWGMLACHHKSARQVPYTIRMACDVLAQVLAATVQTIDARNQAERAERAAVARTRLLETLLQEDDVMRVLALNEAELRHALGAEALVLTVQGKLLHFGDVSPAQAKAIANSLPHHTGEDLLQRNRLDEWPEETRPLLGRWIGLLGLRFDPPVDGWLIALRPEQEETVRWGGNPEKEIRIGPMGPRLTPRGSFGEWRETVRHTAEPWDAADQGIARQLLAELHRVSNSHHAEVERARTQLLAMLGHDLRDPLYSISMAAQVIEAGGNEKRLTQRIQSSSSRMQRLIAQVLDMSRIEAGLGLNLQVRPADLGQLIEDLVDESRIAYPGAIYVIDASEHLVAEVDADRISQVIANLLSNARHHGEPGEPIHLSTSTTADAGRPPKALIRVSNAGLPIEEALVRQLFSPFKRQEVMNQRNRTGLGLGLHIASRIVEAHAGSIGYAYVGNRVVFSVELPLAAPEEPPAAR